MAELSANLLNRIATPVDNYNNMVQGRQAVEVNKLNMENQKSESMRAEASARLEKIAGVLNTAKGDPAKWKQATDYLRSQGIEFDPGEDDMGNADFLIGSTMSAAEQIKAGKDARDFQFEQKKFAADEAYRSKDLDIRRKSLETKTGSRRTQITDANGKRQLIDLDTGEVVRELGASPVRGKPGLSPTEFKAKRESEADILNLEQTLSSLGEALQLAPDVYEGTGAEALTYIGSKVPGGGLIADSEKANKTAQYTSIMSPEAIKTMAATLKGATTDFELRKFESILSDPSQPNNIKKQVITRMLNLAKNKHELETKRLMEFDKRENGGQDDAAPEQSGQIEPGEMPTGDAEAAFAEAQDAISQGADPQAVLQELINMGIDPQMAEEALQQ